MSRVANNPGGPASPVMRAVEILAAGIMLAYPSIMLLVRGGMNGVFAVLLLTAIIVAVIRPAGLASSPWRKEWTAYAVAMFSLTFAMLASQAYHQQFSAHPHDAVSRFWLAIPVFLLLQRLRHGVFELLQYGFPIAALLGFLIAWFSGDYQAGRLKLDTMDLIHFGDFELMFGVLSLASLNWFGRDGYWLKLLKAAGLAAGLAASFASGSRGGWLAIPVFVILLFYFKTMRPSWRTLGVAVSAALLVLLSLYTFNTTFKSRVDELGRDALMFREGNPDTSTGIRWQLYKASARIFAEHPLFGVGPVGFASEMQAEVEAGRLTPLAAELGRAEVHNDILSKAAGMGIFGLAGILSIYLVPLWLFWRAGRSGRREARRAAVMGMIFVCGFLIFGLTVEVLNLTMAVAFYSFTVAVLLAACYNRNHDNAHHSTEDTQHV